MKQKPVIPRRLAETDIDSAFNFYLAEGGTDAAIAFVDAIEQAVIHISRHPATGSPRYAYELDLPDLRYWHVKNFPYFIFYIEVPTHVDVWRVLHSHADIQEWVHDADD